MKAMPWFKWYPTDADSDQNFRLMDDADIGFYIRCLNHAWVNGGIPADPSERARVLRTRKDVADRRWIRVGPCFRPAEELGVTSPNAGTILCNPRQEVERKLASRISEVRAESAKMKSNSSANAPTRARSRSVSVSDAPFLPGGPGGADISARVKSPVRIIDGAAFRRWIEPWPRVGKPDEAARTWISMVNSPADEEAAFAARDRYLASEEVSRGVLQEPANFLLAQSRGGWAGKWPPAKKNGSAAIPSRREEKPTYSQAEIDALLSDDDPRIREVGEQLTKDKLAQLRKSS